MNKVALIGGTGFSALFEQAERLDVETPWGSVEVGVTKEVFLVHRHGRDVVAPHCIRHRANIEALVRCGVDAIIAINAVGGLRTDLAAGSLLVPDDLIDLRKTTETFHEDRAVHIDMTEPYCPHLRQGLIGPGVVDGGVYVATQGPRLETRAEIRMLQQLGGAVVGMTGCPEAALARERGICYASLCMVVNAAAGVVPGPLHAQQMRADAESLAPRALGVAMAAAREVTPARTCRCRSALDLARI